MAEENQEKKKPVKIKPILRWINLILLALLLTIAIVFQVTWKITTILVIVLLACTLLPMRQRKWFWLSAAVVLIILLVWVFLPDGNDTWWPFTLDEELAGHEEKYALAEGENAATIYNGLLQGFVPNEMKLQFLAPGVRETLISEPWLAQDHPKLAQWLDRHRDTIKTLREIQGIEKCRFPSIFRLRFRDLSEVHRYTALKSWAILLLLSANNDVAEGRHQQALSKYACILQIINHLYQQKRMFDFLIGFGIEGLALPPLNKFVMEGSLSEQEHLLISNMLGDLENNWASDFLECLEYDKLFVKNTFCSLVYQKNPKGQVRLSRNPAEVIWGRRRSQRMTEQYWQRKSLKAYTILVWLFFPSNPQKAGKMIDSIFEQCHGLAGPEFARDKENIDSADSLTLNCRFLVKTLTNKSTRLYGGFRHVYMTRLSQRRGLRLLIATKQYNIKNGRWPESLDAIKSSAPPEAFIDPVNNGPFIYKTADDSFTLYSKGENNLDENGKSDKWSFQDQGPDDWLFWPAIKYQAKKEKTNDEQQ